MSKKKQEFKYLINVIWSEEDMAYLANVPELPGCQTHGDTYEDAVKAAQDAIGLYLESLAHHHEEIPVPMSQRQYNGNIPLRIDPSLHGRLVKMATLDEAKSFNKWLEARLRVVAEKGDTMRDEYDFSRLKDARPKFLKRLNPNVTKNLRKSSRSK